MATDANLQLQAPVTVTALGATPGAAVDLLARFGLPRRGVPCRLLVANVSSATAGSTVQHYLEHSSDNASWSTLVSFVPYTTTTTATTDEQFAEIPGHCKRYLRASVSNAAGAGATPTSTFQVDACSSMP